MFSFYACLELKLCFIGQHGIWQWVHSEHSVTCWRVLLSSLSAARISKWSFAVTMYSFILQAVFDVCCEHYKGLPIWWLLGHWGRFQGSFPTSTSHSKMLPCNIFFLFTYKFVCLNCSLWQSQIRHLLKLLEKSQFIAFIIGADAHGKELCLSAHLIVLDVLLAILLLFATGVGSK